MKENYWENEAFLRIFRKHAKRLSRLRKKAEHIQLTPQEKQLLKQKPVKLAKEEFKKLTHRRQKPPIPIGKSPLLYGRHTPSTKTYFLRLSKFDEIKLEPVNS